MKGHVHHDIATQFPDLAKSGLIPGKYSPLNYNDELTITSRLYAGAIPTHTIETIRTHLQQYATEQTQHLTPSAPEEETNTWKPLLYVWKRILRQYPPVAKVVKPVLTQTTTSVHKVIETTITHIHYALIFRATAMQRIATALVRKRQQQLRRKFIHGTTTQKTTHNLTRDPPPHQSQTKNEI